MPPQEATSGGMPTPRKLNDASTTMAYPRVMVLRTINVAITLGRICRSMIRVEPAPIARAARV